MLNYFTAQPWLLYLIVAISGVIIGSFVNVIIYRLPEMLYADPDDNIRPLDLSYPPSHCPKCQHKLAIWQLIPLFSYIMLRGKCHYCKTKISITYPMVEFGCMLTTLICFLSFNTLLVAVAASILSFILIAAIAIDAKHQLLPDALILPGLWIGLIFNLQHTFADITQAIYGAIAGYLLLWFVAYIYKLIRKRHGLGHGDMKMLAMLGAWFGIAWVFVILFIGVLLALLSAVSMLLSKQLKPDEAFAFGPYLAIAAWIVLFLKPLLIPLISAWLA